MSAFDKFSSRFNATVIQVAGSPYLYHSSCFSRARPLPSLAKREKQGLPAVSDLRIFNSPFPPSQGRVSLVEGQPGSFERESSCFGCTRSNNRDRCLATGLGTFCNGVSTGGQWSQGVSFAHKLPRAPCWGLCRQDLCEGQNSNEGLPINGQHNCSPLHKQDGRHQIPCPGQYGSRSLGVVLTSQHPPRSAVLTRSSKYSGRPGTQSIFRPTRLKARPPDLCRTKPGLGPLTNRLVPNPSLHSTPTFFQLETRPSFRGSRCLLPRLGHCEGYAFPPFALVGRCLRKLLDENVPHLVLVTPVWQSQPWYALLLELCVAPPILFPRYQGLLTWQGEAHPLVNLPLVGWLLSASHTQKQAFHNQLSPCLSQPGGMEPPSPMCLLGETGIAGVENGSLIRFRLLWNPF